LDDASLVVLIQMFLCRRLGHWPKGEDELKLVEVMFNNMTMIMCTYMVQPSEVMQQRVTNELESIMVYHEAGMQAPVLEAPPPVGA